MRGTDGSLWHKWQKRPNGTTGWSDWAAERGVSVASDPTVARNADGRLEVFVRGDDGTLRHKWQTGNSAQPWSAWASERGLLTNDPAVAQDLGGCLEVFVLGADQGLWRNWQAAPNNGWN